MDILTGFDRLTGKANYGPIKAAANEIGEVDPQTLIGLNALLIGISSGVLSFPRPLGDDVAQIVLGVNALTLSDMEPLSEGEEELNPDQMHAIYTTGHNILSGLKKANVIGSINPNNGQYNLTKRGRQHAAGLLQALR